MDSVDEVKRALTKMDVGELKQVMAAAQVIHDAKHARQSTETQESRAATEIHAAMDLAFTTRLGTGVAPLHVIKKGASSALFTAAVQRIENMVKRSTMPESIASGPDRIALYRTIVELMIEDLQRINVPVSLKTVLQVSVPQLEGIVDRAFPGYAQSRLLGILVVAGR
jgi:hypothetical protein